MTTAVSIVIPTWNGVELLKRFLPSVIDAARFYLEHSHSPIEIVVVDDGSSDGTADWLRVEGFVESPGEPKRDAGPALRFVRSSTNRGFGDACNRGFENARFGLVFLLNNDAQPDVDSIEPLVENFDDETVFAAHCRVSDPATGQECGTGKVGGFARGFVRVHRSYVPLPDRVDHPDGELPRGRRLLSMFAGGGAAMFDREKFLEMGGFEPLLSPFYWEDVELSYKAWKRGYSIVYEPRSGVTHQVSSTIGRLNRRRVRTIEQRNRLVFHWIHLHDPALMLSHAAWVLLLLITSPLRLRPEFVSSCIAAASLLPKIRKLRREEKLKAARTDREIFGLFARLEARPDLFVYDDYCELQSIRRTES